MKMVVLWDSVSHTRSFQATSEHKHSLGLLLRATDEWVHAEWEEEKNSPPSWQDIHHRLVSEGKFIRLQSPSEDQRRQHIPKILPAPGAFRLLIRGSGMGHAAP